MATSYQKFNHYPRLLIIKLPDSFYIRQIFLFLVQRFKKHAIRSQALFFFMWKRGYQYRLLPLLFLSQVITIAVIAQTDSAAAMLNTKKQKNIYSFSLGAQYGFIFVHSKQVINSKGSHPVGLEFSYSWQKNDTSIVDICNCYPRKGVTFSYYNYDNHALGKGFGPSYFLEPFYRVKKNTFFSFKGGLGVAYLTNPADTIRNPANHSYSTNFNVYLMLGMGMWFRLNDHWWLNGLVNFQHVSNGGMRLPNAGINWPTADITLSYQKNPMPYYTGSHNKEKSWKDYSIRWDLTLFGIEDKVVDNKKKKLYPIVGTGFEGSKQVGMLNALTFGAEIFTDPGRSLELKQQNSIDVSPVRAGFLVGHEFLLGRFLFSQRLGAYVFNQTPYPRIFHRWGLLYRIKPNWSAGFNLLAHGKVANFFDLRVAYSWQKRRGMKK
jgi:hypothetical protein